MAEPVSGISQQDFVEQTADAEQPEVTSPRIVRLYLLNLTGGGGAAPNMRLIDDTGDKYVTLIMEEGGPDGGIIPYFDNNLGYVSILRMSSDLLYMILDGNLYLGDETGTGAVNRKIIFPTGAALGTIELGANGSNDGNQHLHYLPQTDAATQGQVLANSTAPGTATHQWDFQTADVCLARAVSVDLNSTAKQTLYTVPASRSCIITKVVKRDASATVTTAVGAFGFNAGGDDVVASFNVFDKLTGTTVYDISEPKVAAVKGSATNTFGYKGSVAEGAARTMVVDVFGYLL